MTYGRSLAGLTWPMLQWDVAPTRDVGEGGQLKGRTWAGHYGSEPEVLGVRLEAACWATPNLDWQQPRYQGPV